MNGPFFENPSNYAPADGTAGYIYKRFTSYSLPGNHPVLKDPTELSTNRCNISDRVIIYDQHTLDPLQCAGARTHPRLAPKLTGSKKVPDSRLKPFPKNCRTET